MVERSVSCRVERSSLSMSEHGYNQGRQAPYRNHSSHALSSGSHHGSYRLNSNANNLYAGSNHGNSLGGSSHHTRGMNRNKSFQKPKLTATNSGYDPLGGNSNHSCRSTGSSFQHSYKKPVMPQKHQYLAMDCEMVGTVTGESVAARVVLIDWKGRPVLDTYMKPNEAVADYRTFVSGITEENLVDAPSFEEAVQQCKEMLEDKILVGHGVDNDLRALGITHPWLMTRDTAYYQPFMRLLESSTNAAAATTPVWGPRKLKDLAKEKLQRDIQVAGQSHCPIEDAAAALDLYKSHRPRWEACMSTEEKQQQQHALQMAAAQAAYDAMSASHHVPHINHRAAGLYALSSSPPSSFAPSRTSSASSSVSSRDDLSVSVHSYFGVAPPSTRTTPLAPPPGLDLPTLQTGFGNNENSNVMGMGRQSPSSLALTFDAPSFQPRSLSKSSLDSWSHHGPISRPYHRSDSFASSSSQTPDYQSPTGRDYHSMKQQQLQSRHHHRPPLQRHVSLGYPASSSNSNGSSSSSGSVSGLSHYTNGSNSNNSNDLYHTASILSPENNNTAVY